MKGGSIVADAPASVMPVSVARPAVLLSARRIPAARRETVPSRFMDTARPARGGCEGYALEPRHVERNVAGGRGEIPVIVTAAVALTGLAALVAGRLLVVSS